MKICPHLPKSLTNIKWIKLYFFDTQCILENELQLGCTAPLVHEDGKKISTGHWCRFSGAGSTRLKQHALDGTTAEMVTVSMKTLKYVLKLFRDQHMSQKLPSRVFHEDQTFRSFALSFPGATSPQINLSFLWNFHSVEHSLLRTFAPVELSFLGSERSKNYRSLKLSFLWLQNE